jgi:hypothetical protein
MDQTFLQMVVVLLAVGNTRESPGRTSKVRPGFFYGFYKF